MSGAGRSATLMLRRPSKARASKHPATHRAGTTPHPPSPFVGRWRSHLRVRARRAPLQVFHVAPRCDSPRKHCRQALRAASWILGSRPRMTTAESGGIMQAALSDGRLKSRCRLRNHTTEPAGHRLRPVEWEQGRDPFLPLRRMPEISWPNVKVVILGVYRGSPWQAGARTHLGGGRNATLMLNCPSKARASKHPPASAAVEAPPAFKQRPETGQLRD